MASFARLTVCITLLLVAAPALAQWSAGRATFYGTDGWSIHTGSCQYGQLAEDVGTGWDVAALFDVAKDYRGSCGKCKELRCRPSSFKDGYGAWLDRKNVCYDPTASVIVMVVDTCPCYFPTNYFSNKRWCCGDMYHLDISLWAFEKLADTKYGVIGMEWRDVSCSYRPTNPARNPFGQRSAMPAALKPRPGWTRWQDRRLSIMQEANPTSIEVPAAATTPALAAVAQDASSSSGSALQASAPAQTAPRATGGLFGWLFGRR